MTDSPDRILKRKLADRRLVKGVRAEIPSADLVEFLAPLGFDFIFIDCEHAGPDFQTVVQMARAARAGGVTTLLRPWSVEPGLVRRFIDCGVGGILAPGIESAAQAESVLATIAAAGPPDLEGFVFAPLIESKSGVENLNDILAIEGVDLIVVGASDLALSVGEPRSGDAPVARELVFKALDRAKAAGKSAGLPASRFGAEAAWRGGANVLISSTNEVLTLGSDARLDELAAIAGE
jgi:2-keto-3-deoxy-L-rhamnonate aldolase RhmA